MTIRIEIIDDATNVVQQTIVTGSYLVAYERDGQMVTAGSMGIDWLLKQAAPLVGSMMPSFGFGRRGKGG